MDLRTHLGCRSPCALAWRPFTTRTPARRSLVSARPLRVVNARKQTDDQQDYQQSPENAVVAAFLAFSAAISVPSEADAKQIQPAPVPTEYEKLQAIIRNRSVDTASALADSISPRIAAVGAGRQKLPAAPKVEGKTQKEPASASPKPAGGLQNPIGGLGKSNDPTSVAKDAAKSLEQQSNLPAPALGAAAAAVLGLGGFALLGGQKKDPVGGAKQAVRKAAPKAQGGTKKIGGGANKAAKKATGPIKSAIGGVQKQSKQPQKAASGLFGSAKQQAKKPAKAAGGLFGSAKQQAKQPAKSGGGGGGLFGSAKQQAKKPAKAAGGLFGGAKQQAKKPAKAAGGLFGSAQQQSKKPAKAAGGILGQAQKVAKQAPKATKKITKQAPKQAQRGTQKVGAGTRKIGASSKGRKQPSRIQLDDDTVSTLQAVGVVGLGVLAGGFLILNVLLGSEGPDVSLPSGPQEALKKLPDVPNPLPSKPQDIAKDTSKAAGQAGAKLTSKAEDVTNAPPETARKAEGAAQKSPKIAEKAGEAVSKAQDAAPNPPSSPVKQAQGAAAKAQEAIPNVAAKAQDAAPTSSAAPVKQAQEAIPQVAEKVQDAAPSPPPEIQAAPGIASAPAAGSQRPQEVLPQVSEAPKASAAFQEAAKKLGSGPSAADQFKAAVAQPTEKNKGGKGGLSAANASPVGGFQSKGATIQSTQKSQPESKKSAGGNNNTLIFGGLVIAGGIAAAVASPKGAQAPTAQATSAQPSPAGESSASSGGGGSSSDGGGGGGDIKDDIAGRKADAKAWIDDWRDRTGGK